MVKKYGLVWEQQTEQVIEQLKTNKVYLEEDESLKITQDPDNQKSNIIIEGDNYEALTYMVEVGQKVDVIYIDPPYNTGNTDFVYNDRFINKDDEYKHSKWLSFMDARLRLARELLTDDGVIFISIDDNEQSQLKLLCDEVFGEDNLIANFVVKTGNQTSDINKKKVHEYLLSYGKKIRGMEGNKKLIGGKEVLQEGRCTTGNLNQTMPELKFLRGIEVEGVEDGKYESPRGTGGKEDIELISGNIIVKDGKLEEDIILKARWSNSNDIRKYMEKHETGGDYPIYNKFGKELVRLYMKGDRFQPQLVKKGTEDVPTVLEGVNGKGSLDLANMDMGDTFSYPKAVKFIKYIIGTYYDKNATVLDFFAGSGTTGHAVLELNKEDGGNRQFILVTNNENNIARDITYERNKRVIEGYTTPKGKDIQGIPSNLTYYRTKQIAK